jgi:hypothetical protein
MNKHHEDAAAKNRVKITSTNGVEVHYSSVIKRCFRNFGSCNKHHKAIYEDR